MSANYPLILQPIYKHYLWGGSRIPKTFNRSLPDNIYAESWEVSDRIEGQTLILNGALKNHPLKTLSYGGSHFPLLVKLIDAHKPLSIQVHPCDRTASLYGGEPKSEMWHILEAEEGSYIYLGLKENMSAAEIQMAIANETLENHMKKVYVKKGETYNIPGGLLHSIGKGCLIYEVQQNSNTTYRLYDFGRKDQDGNLRMLHVKEALQVMLKEQAHVEIPNSILLTDTDHMQRWKLHQGPHFTFYKWKMNADFHCLSKPFLRIFFLLEGELKLGHDELLLKKGQTFLLPPNTETLLKVEKEITLLETEV